ncbi:protein SCO1/2 [Pontibacter ummariensis]|uniref:Protein SCO1/2 n=1 Tax=Pontibacter ummariensis TaxID=1610492 RepID=A0A239HXH0_9BACT|nr:SCO family protein [Pontibacter ummariensis]PRY10110.1 protein SCO1/2 [Pontibacter ummariensis]SNS86057.1 protein SCO1/2 [Pontibacter ummariensis]
MKRYTYLLLLPLLFGLPACQEEELGCCSKPAAEHASASATHATATPTAALTDMSLYNLESEWQNQEGRKMKLPELQGKVQLVSMIFTNCSYACPRIIADLKRIETELQQLDRDDVGIVLVTMDPERDTPARLKEFATDNKLDPSRWTLLTGEAEAIRELSALLNMKYKQELDGNISHANMISVLNEQGELVHQQEGLGVSPEATVQAVQGLVQAL